MATVFDVFQNDYGGDGGATYASATPYWIVAVFRLAAPITYSRENKSSFSKSFNDGVEIVGKPFIITDDCIQLQVSCSKSNYTTQLNAVLANSGINYLSQIFPGDYIFAWMVNSKTQFDSLIERLNAGYNKDASSNMQEDPQDKFSCNRFDDGLKFYGRVQSIRKNLSQQPNGVRVVRYSLNGVGFSEFDAQIFYNPYLAEKQGAPPQIATFFAKLGAALTEFINKPDTSEGNGGVVAAIDVNKVIPFLLDLLLGRGVPKNMGVPVLDEELSNTAGLDAEASYIVPPEVCAIFGKDKGTSSFYRFADILECVVGVQKYSNESSIGIQEQTTESENRVKALNFQPDGAKEPKLRRIIGGMLGSFQPQIPHFTNKPVWTIVKQYLNEAVNEMYTCLRVNPNGLIVPTFIARQFPFSSPVFKITSEGRELAHTEFLTLPRWKINPVLVKDVDVGRSDALRFNFIHVYGDYNDPNRTITQQLVENPPIIDNLDVARGGLRMHMQTVACSAISVRDGSPKKWMALTSDFLMGQQMSMNGTMNTFGIQSPICPGDNLEWDDMVFHIESVSHSCSISPLGQKTFVTSLALSHGVSLDKSIIRGDIDIYGAVNSEEMTKYDPGTTSHPEATPEIVDRASIMSEKLSVAKLKRRQSENESEDVTAVIRNGTLT